MLTSVADRIVTLWHPASAEDRPACHCEGLHSCRFSEDKCNAAKNNKNKTILIILFGLMLLEYMNLTLSLNIKKDTRFEYTFIIQGVMKMTYI